MRPVIFAAWTTLLLVALTHTGCAVHDEQPFGQPTPVAVMAFQVMPVVLIDEDTAQRFERCVDRAVSDIVSQTKVQRTPEQIEARAGRICSTILGDQ